MTVKRQDGIDFWQAAIANAAQGWQSWSRVSLNRGFLSPMASVAQLPAALRLPAECGDEEVTSTLVASLTSAVHDEEPAISLPDLRNIISADNEHRYLVRITSV